MMDRSDGESFAIQLRKYRKRAQLSQIVLADLSTVSVRAVRNLEHGQVSSPRPETVRLLAEILKLTTQERIAFELASGNETDESAVQALTVPSEMVMKPLYGRARELDVLTGRLRSGFHRISSVCGLAGVGKTQLALAAGHRLQAMDAMAMFFMRASPAATEAMDRAEPLSLLGEDGRSVNRLIRRIGNQRALLIIDGNDRGEVTREAMWCLTSECPNLCILETSRHPKAVEANYRLPLGPLSTCSATNDSEAPTDAPALRLLLELISDLRPHFAPSRRDQEKLGEVCLRLDGLPSAIEAAASWATVISVDEVLAMARDEPQELATHPSGLFDPVFMAHEAVMSQTRHHRDLLFRLCDGTEGWTVERTVNRLGLPRLQAASSLQSLLQSGLLVEVTERADGIVRFVVPNLVREYVRNQSAPSLAMAV